MSTALDSFVILGASGDLASRLLLPALGQLVAERDERGIRLIGSGIEKWSDDEWRQTVSEAFASVDAAGDAVDDLVAHTRYVSADVTRAHDLAAVLDAAPGTPALYFALPPAITARACEQLRSLDLPRGTRLALEKPFGTDHDGAVALNRVLSSLVPEDHIHRMDHFLGRSTVLNLLGLRFANRLFEPVWNSEHIDSVDIIFDERLGLEGRARYYDTAGALVDMVQSHLLQVLSVVAMEPVASIGERDLRDAKAAVLRATHVWGDDPTASTRRARYTAGEVAGRDYPSYVDEDGVDPKNATETLAEVRFAVDNWRWRGVPFTVRSGKAIGRNRYEIVVRFKSASWIPSGLRGGESPTVLRLRLGPDDVALELNVNGPGDPHQIDHVAIGADFGPGQLLAYGEVLSGLIDGDPTLSVRGDTAEECWRILEPVVSAWRSGEVPLEEYPAGSAGPSHWPELGVPESGGWDDSAGSAHGG